MKMYRTSAILFLCLTLGFVPIKSVTAEPGRALIGHVNPDNQDDEKDWSVEVWAVIEGRSKKVFSDRHTYFFDAVDNTDILFIFQRPYYRENEYQITVSADMSNPYWMLPDVTLYKINPEEEEQALAPTTGESFFINVSYNMQDAEALKRARERLRKRLLRSAELARLTGSKDIFQFNLEVYEDAYRKFPQALRDDITNFKRNPTFRDVTRAPAGRSELYRKMIQRNRGEQVDIDPASLLQVADDAALAPSIRVQSIRSMRPRSTESPADDETLNFLRTTSNNPSSELYLSSLTQLIKIGSDADRNEIVKELEGRDVRRTSSVLTAIEAAQWKGGEAAVKKLADSETVQPVVRERAHKTVRTLDRVRVSRDVVQPKVAEATQTVQLFGPLKGTLAVFKVSQRTTTSKLVEVSFPNFRPDRKLGTFVLWAVEGDRIVRLGQLTSAATSPMIKGATSLRQFTLLLTSERLGTVTTPSNNIVAKVNFPFVTR